MDDKDQTDTSSMPDQTNTNEIGRSHTNNKTDRKITFAVSEKNQPDSELSLSRPDFFLTSNSMDNIDKDSDNDNEDENKNNRGETGKTDYRKVALDLAVQRSSKVQQKDTRESLPDFVLAYDVHDMDALHKKEREIFEAKIQDEDITIVYDIVGNSMFVQLYPTFERLCHEAEAVALEMPLEGVC